MEAKDVDASFRANRARLQRLAGVAVMFECWWLCGQLLALDVWRARTGLLAGVALWLVWVRWQLGANWVPTWPTWRLTRPVRAVLLRSVALFCASLVWQWASGRWLLSWHSLFLVRGHGLGAVAWHRLFLLIVWVPLVEEIAFRVVTPRLLRLRLPEQSRAAAALMGAFVFSTYHMCNLVISDQPTTYVAMQCVVAFTAGCASAAHVDGTAAPPALQQPLWEALLVHVVNNAIASVFRLAGHFDEALVWVNFILINASNVAWYRATISQ